MASTTEKAPRGLARLPHITTPLLVLFVFAAMHLSRFVLTKAQNPTNLFLSIALVQIMVLVLPCMLYYLLKGRKLSSPMFLTAPSPRHIGVTLSGALVLVVGSLFIKFFYRVSSEQSVSISGFFDRFSAGEADPPFAGVLLSTVIIPAVCEELFFRGVVLAEYRTLGEGNAIVVSAVCFAMLHFSVSGFPIYLFIGLLLGVITSVSRSVLPAMLLHLLSNTLNVYTSDQFLKIIMQKNGAFFVGFLLAVLFGTALFLLLYNIEHMYRRYAAEPPEGSLPPKSRTHLAKVFLSPTFLVLTAVFLLVTALQ